MWVFVPEEFEQGDLLCGVLHRSQRERSPGPDRGVGGAQVGRHSRSVTSGLERQDIHQCGRDEQIVRRPKRLCRERGGFVRCGT